jgi:hypothetical protein
MSHFQGVLGGSLHAKASRFQAAPDPPLASRDRRPLSPAGSKIFSLGTERHQGIMDMAVMGKDSGMVFVMMPWSPSAGCL